MANVKNNIMSKMCSNEAFARTVGFYLKIDYENNLIFVWERYKMLKSLNEDCLENSDFQSGWGIHSYTYSNLYQFLIRVGKKMMNQTTTKS